MSEPTRSVVIVAGGRSRRLGRSKPFVEIGGRAILFRLLDATSHIADRVLAVREASPFERALRAEAWKPAAPVAGGPPGSVAFGDPAGRRLLIVSDPVSDLGPLAGLASGLEAASAPICVALAGDLPFVSRDVVDGLGEALAAAPEADAVVPRARDRRQPLCAAYRRAAGEVVGRLLAQQSEVGVRSPSMMSFLDRLRVRYVEAGDLPGSGDLDAITRGVDSPDDLIWAARYAARGD
ncbi:molybdenum cofactor guanylyltransferase [Candidatus Palauibacter sp.]|uniref:molybdenum cofactor guanylyltransferase n=1 Tax=Candidatus Palauibacter sp. TaxID=3101350 RepID=UPI003B52CA3F